MSPSKRSHLLSLPVFVSALSAALFIPIAQGGSTTLHEFGGHIYLIVDESASWAEANANAESSLGHLATVESETENQFLYTNLLNRAISTTAADGGGARYAWLGGNDVAQEGTWRWLNGNLMSTGYTKWGNGFWGSEPDDFNSAQDHLALGLEGWPISTPGGMGDASEWNDVNGLNSLAYIIEYDSPDLDRDKDGMPDWQEFISGTDPTNGVSVLQLQIGRSGQDGIVLSWEGANECSYSIETKTSLLQSTWVSITNLPGEATLMAHTNDASASPSFFLIRAER
jgi:hypothetical protein